MVGGGGVDGEVEEGKGGEGKMGKRESGERVDVGAHNPIHVIETVDPGGRPKPSGHSRKGEGRLTEK